MRYKQGRSEAGSSSESSSSSESENSHAEEEEPSVEDIQKIVLNTALEFVPIHGWTVKSLAEAAKHEGYPGVAHGMFPRGGGDLMHHFVRECNAQLADQLALEASKEVEEGERYVHAHVTTFPFLFGLYYFIDSFVVILW